MATIYAPTTIDFSRLPRPQAIEALDFESLYGDFKTRFLAAWDELRADNPSLPEYDTLTLEADPAGILGEAWSYLRLLDRQRVNDAYVALLAPLATGANLDAIAASRNLVRQVITPATSTTAAVMQSDASLLRDYLLSFDMPAAGSRDRYLFEAFRAWPQNDDKTVGLWDARVNGHAVHGRKGDVDVVIVGPFGRLPTTGELATVRTAVTAPKAKPEAVSVAVMPATRLEYQASLTIEIPPGPDPVLVVNEAKARVQAVATERTIIGGEIPTGLLSGAAYGSSIIKVRDEAPVAIAPDPYVVPVMMGIEIIAEVRT
ncbi:baseplate J/gp47 family protein [Shinella zoogloeoides]|uniref:baseplate J/gp47 family protein n=1 Tax=Shinella zoogloeoides TaxID=352475 RepID=UPI001F568770|nr:baseplate J/gp47 family protein [Shinella zoogloeoides]